jgi:hypothetical protein
MRYKFQHEIINAICRLFEFLSSKDFGKMNLRAPIFNRFAVTELFIDLDNVRQGMMNARDRSDEDHFLCLIGNLPMLSPRSPIIIIHDQLYFSDDRNVFKMLTDDDPDITVLSSRSVNSNSTASSKDRSKGSSGVKRKIPLNIGTASPTLQSIIKKPLASPRIVTFSPTPLSNASNSSSSGSSNNSSSGPFSTPSKETPSETRYCGKYNSLEGCSHGAKCRYAHKTPPDNSNARAFVKEFLDKNNLEGSLSFLSGSP